MSLTWFTPVTSSSYRSARSRSETQPSQARSTGSSTAQPTPSASPPLYGTTSTGTLVSSRPQVQPREYMQSSLRTESAAHQAHLSGSGPREDQGSASLTTTVTASNPTMSNNSSPENGAPVSDMTQDNEDNRRSFGNTVETDPYYMPVPPAATQPRQDSGLGRASSSEAPQTQGNTHASNRAPKGHFQRNPGKRLTTREEASLFEICNDHAGIFGRRSDICNFWKTIAAEFTKIHGRPYSWHSVRRKVEMATKQRIKFLQDQQRRQRDPSSPHLVQDMMNPEWCAALDRWIPTWQRWEESEARRIRQRNAIMRRRAQPGHRDILLRELLLHSPLGPHGVDADADNSMNDDEMAGETVDDPIAVDSPDDPKLMAPSAAAQEFKSPPRRTASSVRMPPGFETMFSHPQHTSPVPTTSAAVSDHSANGPMVNSVLETLGKLNKHLDAATGNGRLASRPSPVVSALAQGASESTIPATAPSQETQRQPPNVPAEALDINQIKEELRQEMRAELRQTCGRLEAKMDSIQRTLAMIFEMLGHVSP